MREQFAPQLKDLGVAVSGYHFYPAAYFHVDAMTDEALPFEGNAASSQAPYAAGQGLIRREQASAGAIPAYYISPDGQVAYFALLKADGSFVIWRLQQVVDSGFCLWMFSSDLSIAHVRPPVGG